MIHQMKGNYSEISNTFMFLVCDVITWRHKGKTIKYRPFRRSKWQKFYNHSCVIHQMKDIYSEISNIFKFLIYDVITWRHKGKTTKYRRFRWLKWQQLCKYSSVLHDVIKEKLLSIAVLCDLSDKSITVVVVWYIKWKIFN